MVLQPQVVARRRGHSIHQREVDSVPLKSLLVDERRENVAATAGERFSSFLWLGHAYRGVASLSCSFNFCRHWLFRDGHGRSSRIPSLRTSLTSAKEHNDHRFRYKELEPSAFYTPRFPLNSKLDSMFWLLRPPKRVPIKEEADRAPLQPAKESHFQQERRRPCQDAHLSFLGIWEVRRNQDPTLDSFHCFSSSCSAVAVRTCNPPHVC